MPEPRYFELLDLPSFREPAWLTNPGGEHLDPIPNPKAGELAPFVAEGMTVGVPTMVRGELQMVARRIELKPMPGARILKIDDPLVANAIQSHPHYREVDPPKSEQPHKPKQKTNEKPPAGEEG